MGQACPVSVLTALTALGIVVGLIGTVVVVFPGMLIVWGSVLAWALVGDNPYRWWVLGFASLLFLASLVLKYLVPGRRLNDAGVPGWALLAAGAGAVVGFFVLPVIGFFVGFVAGLLAAELTRRRDLSAAWPATKQALGAVGISVAIELFVGLLIAAGWAAAVVAA
jgi:uncharacterized protein YqgC (DUF456 family)